MDSVVATRLDKLGIRQSAKDGLIKWAIVVLAGCEFKLTGVWPSHHATYTRVVSLKKLLQGFPPCGARFLDRVLEHPRDLSKSIYDMAYIATDPPTERYIPTYDQLTQHVPLRSSSKLLSGQGIVRTAIQDPMLKAIESLSAVMQRRDSHCDLPITYFDRRHDPRGSSQSWGSPTASPQSPPRGSPRDIAPRAAGSHDDGAWDVFNSALRSNRVTDAPPPTVSAPPRAPLAIRDDESDDAPRAAPVRRSSEDIEEAAYQAILKKQCRKRPCSSSNCCRRCSLEALRGFGQGHAVQARREVGPQQR